MADAPRNKPTWNVLGWMAFAMVAVLAAQLWRAPPTSVTLDYSDLKAMLGQGRIASVKIFQFMAREADA